MPGFDATREAIKCKKKKKSQKGLIIILNGKRIERIKDDIKTKLMNLVNLWYSLEWKNKDIGLDTIVNICVGL